MKKSAFEANPELQKDLWIIRFHLDKKPLKNISTRAQDHKLKNFLQSQHKSIQHVLLLPKLILKLRSEKSKHLCQFNSTQTHQSDRKPISQHRTDQL